MKPYYTEILVDSWETARNAFKKMTALDNWVFRGQADSNWDLRTSFERKYDCYSLSGPVNARYRKEKHIRDIFISKAHLYESKLPPINNTLEWMGLLQHYGGCTRLLDFTYSFYVAAYFSMENAISNSAIWAIDLFALSTLLEQISEGIDRHLFFNEEEDFIENEFSDYVIKNNYQENLVSYASPGFLNPRSSIQQGVFLLPCNINNSFIENLYSSIIKCDFSESPGKYNFTKGDYDYRAINRWPVIKFIVPKDDHDIALYDLKDMNITSETLFPGLDGLAKSSSLYFRTPLPTP